jgi:hypothetical protein
MHADTAETFSLEHRLDPRTPARHSGDLIVRRVVAVTAESELVRDVLCAAHLPNAK